MSAPTAFFNRTYEETLRLLEDTRLYMTYGRRGDRRPLSDLDRLRLSREAFRITTRLSEIMAWLLVQKAVHAGEIEPDEATRPEHRLTHRRLCLEDRREECGALPPAMLDLLERSHRLYVRVARLDDLVTRGRA